MKKRIDLYVETGQIEELKKLSKKSGAPVSELIRRAVEIYLICRSEDSGEE